MTDPKARMERPCHRRTRGGLTAGPSKVRTMAAQRDQARIYRRITEDGAVVVPPRIASWLERHAGITADLRIRLRGVDPEAYEVLAALRLAALRHSSSDFGTKVGTTQLNTTRSETWLTTSEAAKQVNITDRCVRKWIAEGRLPATRHGGRWLIDRNALALAANSFG
ncbi:helix-turn-helix domain-containing protein [Mycobacterium sp. 1274761.0]|uniref:helix-turn-helix domain-containing protein n=1 Tax=Mycobacterium sp. 1274761.0 TaxID=1834077 RepID=UPI000A7AB4D0|nr:helix-turn-helix domain-containing protein [Mycobacterium sp. 1274761.0]